MHEVETMMYRGETPWHGLGNPLSDEGLTDWRKACQEAGLDWEVELAPLSINSVVSAPAGIVGDVVTHRAAVRVSDGKVLGVVGPDYTVLQNKDAFKWFAPILATGEVSFEAAGSLRGGSRVWALAKIDGTEGEVRPGDSVRRYILLSHSHDGTLCVRAGYTDVRVVCMNTLRAAHDSEASKLIRLKHTANVKANLEAVREVMEITSASFKAAMLQYQRLQSKGINRNDVLRYVELVFEPKANKEGELSTRTENRINEIVDLAFSGIGNVGATMWDAYNAITEWTTWRRGRSQENRLNSVWFGETKKVNDKALSIALELVD